MPEEGGKRSVRVVASSAAVDSYDEIVEQSWDLSRFLANPVILWAHQSRSMPIGYASDVGLVSGNLEMTINFVDEKANPMAPQVYESYKQGSMRAVSVGFYPRDVRMEMRDGKEVFVLANNVLLECSCTPIGANPEALAKQHALIRSKALATKGQELRGASASNESPGASASKELPGAERAIATENGMDPKEKAALDAANSEREAAVKALADEKAKVKRLTASLVKALVECGRFAKDEIEEQTELAEKSFDLFERLAAKRVVRGVEVVNAKKMPDPPAGGVGEEPGAGAGIDLLDDGEAV